MRLYLIRHGEPSSKWGEADPDPGLSARGLQQAQITRDWLLARPQDERPRRVASSPMRRCRETAGPLADVLGQSVEIDPLVGEIKPPGGLAAEARRDWLKTAMQGRWDEIRGDVNYDGWRDDLAAGLAARGGWAVFSHYVAINAVVSRVLDDPRVVVFPPDHASITVLDTDGQTLRLIAKGAEAHTGVLL